MWGYDSSTDLGCFLPFEHRTEALRWIFVIISSKHPEVAGMSSSGIFLLLIFLSDAHLQFELS